LAALEGFDGVFSEEPQPKLFPATMISRLGRLSKFWQASIKPPRPRLHPEIYGAYLPRNDLVGIDIIAKFPNSSHVFTPLKKVVYRKILTSTLSNRKRGWK
jgi:hypothetical protein